MSTGFLQAAGVWIEAAEYPPLRSPARVLRHPLESLPPLAWMIPASGALPWLPPQELPPPRRAVRQPGPSSDTDLPAPAWFVPTGEQATRLAYLPQEHQPRPLPPRRLPADATSSRILFEPDDETLLTPSLSASGSGLALAAVAGTRRLAGLPPAPPPTEPPFPPVLTAVETLYGWRDEPPGRPSGALATPRPWEPPPALWVGLTASQGEPALAMISTTADASRAARGPSRGPAVPQDGPPALYAVEALVAPVDGWHTQQPARRDVQARTPAPVVEFPPAAWVLDVSPWPAGQVQTPTPAVRWATQARPAFDATAGAVLFAAAGLNADVLAAPLSSLTLAPPRRPSVALLAPSVSEPYLALALPVPWLAETQTAAPPRMPPRQAIASPPGDQLVTTLWVVAPPFYAAAAAIYVAGAVEADAQG